MARGVHQAGGEGGDRLCEPDAEPGTEDGHPGGHAHHVRPAQ